MIHHVPPALDHNRIDQMIATAMTVPQDKRKRLIPDFFAELRPTFRFGLGFSGALVAASIMGLVWMNPTVTTQSPVTKVVAHDADTSDLLLYDLLTTLS